MVLRLKKLFDAVVSRGVLATFALAQMHIQKRGVVQGRMFCSSVRWVQPRDDYSRQDTLEHTTKYWGQRFCSPWRLRGQTLPSTVPACKSHHRTRGQLRRHRGIRPCTEPGRPSKRWDDTSFFERSSALMVNGGLPIRDVRRAAWFQSTSHFFLAQFNELWSQFRRQHAQEKNRTQRFRARSIVKEILICKKGSNAPPLRMFKMTGALRPPGFNFIPISSYRHMDQIDSSSNTATIEIPNHKCSPAHKHPFLFTSVPRAWTDVKHKNTRKEPPHFFPCEEHIDRQTYSCITMLDCKFRMRRNAEQENSLPDISLMGA